jgi:hypothetical protein
MQSFTSRTRESKRKNVSHLTISTRANHKQLSICITPKSRLRRQSSYPHRSHPSRNQLHITVVISQRSAPRRTHIITIRTTDILIFILHIAYPFLTVPSPFRSASSLHLHHHTPLSRSIYASATHSISATHSTSVTHSPKQQNVLHHLLNLLLPRMRTNPAHPLRTLQPRDNTQHGPGPLSQPHEETTDKRWEGVWEV